MGSRPAAPAGPAAFTRSTSAEGYVWLDGALGVWEGEFDAERHSAPYRAFIQTHADAGEGR